MYTVYPDVFINSSSHCFSFIIINLFSTWKHKIANYFASKMSLCGNSSVSFPKAKNKEHSFIFQLGKWEVLGLGWLVSQECPAYLGDVWVSGNWDNSKPASGHVANRGQDAVAIAVWKDGLPLRISPSPSWLPSPWKHSQEKNIRHRGSLYSQGWLKTQRVLMAFFFHLLDQLYCPLK